MKKALILSLFFCLITWLFWKPLLETFCQCEFSFKSVALKKGGLVFSTLSYQKGPLSLSAEEMCVDIQTHTIRLLRPQIIYTGSFPKEQLAEKNPYTWTYLVEEGVLHFGAIQVQFTLQEEEGKASLSIQDKEHLCLEYKGQQWRCSAREIGKEIWNLLPLPWTLMEGTLNFDAMGEKDFRSWTLSWLDGEGLNWETGNAHFHCGHLRAHLDAEGTGSVSFSEGSFALFNPLQLGGTEWSGECTLNQRHFIFSTCSGKIGAFPIEFHLHGTFASWIATGSTRGPFPSVWEVTGEEGNPLFAQAHLELGKEGILCLHWDKHKGRLEGTGEHLFGYRLGLQVDQDLLFDLRLQNPLYDAVRLIGSFDSKGLILDPLQSHLLGEALSLSASFEDGSFDFSSSLARGHLSREKELFLQVQNRNDCKACELVGNLVLSEKGVTLTLSQLLWSLDMGNLNGSGEMCLSPHQFTANLDLEMHGPFFSTRGPVHVIYSSDQGFCASNASLAFPYFDCEIERIEKKGEPWLLKDISATIAGTKLKGDLEVTEGFISGALSPLEDLQVRITSDTCNAKCLFQDIEIELDACFTSKWEGVLRLSEGKDPLVIGWESTLQTPFLIHSIAGSCFGLSSSFYEVRPGVLIGRAKIDFEELSKFVPKDFHDLILSLKMGSGYELKGSLFPSGGESGYFKGLLSGKDLELFGYEFKSLLSHLEIEKDHIRLSQLKISDPAGTLEVPEITTSRSNKEPWHLAIPTLLISSLRPSLLVKPGELRSPLTPLVVRELTLRNLQGQLSNSASYTAEGELDFINTFKRNRSIFDIPSVLLGRLFAIDLEILIPVQGTLTYQLLNGNFELLELKNSFSEASRSEFFLAPGTAPLMDLDGNLDILIKMKQYVLFTFTENFLISVSGTLENPKFHLEKKRKELNIMGVPKES